MDIVVDFDGTCLTHSFPKLGKDIGAVPVLKKLVNNGHRLILFTMRSDGQKSQILDGGYTLQSGDFLSQAVDWFKKNQIPLFGIQINPSQTMWTTSPKAYGQLIIDDAALGCPLKFDAEISERVFVDWVKVEELLKEMKLIK